MTDLQAQLDRGAKSLRRMIAQSIAQADSLCAAGNAKGSADAWKMAALLCDAMAHGRGLEISASDGIIRPAFGGDK